MFLVAKKNKKGEVMPVPIVKICIFATNFEETYINRCKIMRRNVVLGSLLMCANLLMAQTALVDSMIVSDTIDIVETVTVVDTIDVVDTMVVVGDSTMLVQLSDSVSISDSTAIASAEVDSADVVLEQVKVLTDKVSEQSAQLVKEVFSDSIVVNKYNQILDSIVAQYAAEVEGISAHDSVHVNPLYFRLFAPLTLYKSPISQAMAMDAQEVDAEDGLLMTMTSSKDIRLLNELDRVLLSTYLDSPTLVGLTENDLMASQNFSEEAIKKVSESAKFDVPTAEIAPLASGDPLATMDIVVQKPNFWVTKGSFSTQVTESFFSPNWYQGGVNNLNLLSMLTLEANYNNKRKLQWDNKLDARLGFYKNQTLEGAEPEKIQSNQDLLRLTSKLNLKAIRNWNYALEAQGSTQMLNHYQSDDITLKSRFLAPMDASITVGMDFKKTFDKGSISVYPGPLSYKLTYVAVDSLAKSYGIEEEGKKARHDIGSKLEVNFDYQITKNISYKTRFYYFTGRYEYVQIDWENTLNFQVNKYLSTKLFFHARYDDLVEINPEYANWKYYQFKQYLMLGVNYTW